MNQKLSKSEQIKLFKANFPCESLIIDEIRKRNLTYCGYPKLENICRAIREVQDKKVPGVFIEAGCALGGSAILIGKIKPKLTPFYVFDIFGMIPPPSQRDDIDAHQRYKEIASGNSQGLGGDKYYGYLDNLKETVSQNMRDFDLDLETNRIKLIEGLFQDTIDIKEEVALAHIDCDWYDSVKICINRITPLMSKNAFIIFDDYSSYSGCKKAVDELLDLGQFEVQYLARSIVLSKI